MKRELIASILIVFSVFCLAPKARADDLSVPTVISSVSFSNSPKNSKILNADKILALINDERRKENLLPLTPNEKLNQTAEEKVLDMIKNKYFDHVSKDKKTVADIKDYSYVVIGENLALGNFKDENELVASWMKSPAHRANILNKKYRELGLGIALGSFKGQAVTYIANHFALSTDFCPKIDENLKNGIESSKKEIASINAEIEKNKQNGGLTATVFNGFKNYFLIRKYNKSVKDLNGKVEEYNKQVALFDGCAK